MRRSPNSASVIRALCRALVPFAAIAIIALRCQAQVAPDIDTTFAWAGVSISGVDAVAQVITSPPGGATLYAFDFFASPPNQAYDGGVFEWNEATGSVVGTQLAAVSGYANAPVAGDALASARVRFRFAGGVPLEAGKQYLLYANSQSADRLVAPNWDVVFAGAPLHTGKTIFPPNGTVTGPWVPIDASMPPPDWAFSAYFRDPGTLAARTFVASYGRDDARCTHAAPCRTLARAVPLTGWNGEVVVLDSAGYGAVTITTPLSITAAEGVYAGVSAGQFSDAIIVAAGTGTVTLRGLTLMGQGGGIVGIGFVTGSALVLDHVSVSGFSGAGLSVSFNARRRVSVNDSTFADNLTGIDIVADALSPIALDVRRSRMSGSGFAAVRLFGALPANLDGVAFSGNATGVQLVAMDASPVSADLRHCTFVGNQFGVSVQGGFGSAVTATVARSTFVDNAVAARATGDASASIHFSDTTLSGNALALQADSGGTLVSFGNNRLFGNGTDGAFTSTVPLE